MKRFIIAAALAAVVAAPALASTSSFEMDVLYSAEKLQTQAGAQAEYEYIRSQIVERCATEHPGKIYARHYVEQICTKPVLARTIEKIGNSNLKAVHAARS